MRFKAIYSTSLIVTHRTMLFSLAGTMFGQTRTITVSSDTAIIKHRSGWKLPFRQLAFSKKENGSIKIYNIV